MEDEDEHTLLGTPLPDLDDDTIIKKKAIQDLTVRDEKGRQRFHGAFTGGFSAGYFNTVGTKEGWEPSTFVSSRTSKASSSFQQNPEDFMDDEDFGEFGIAPKKIHTTSNFRDSDAASGRKRRLMEGDEIIPGVPPLKDIVKPVIESIGVRILKQMGWRHGQGIGPRVKRKTGSGVKVYGCLLGPLVSNDDDDPLFSQVTFAPDDTPAVPYTPKDDYHGIGYSGLSTQSVLNVPLDDAFSLSKTKSWLAKDKKKLAIRGQAFGVGAFEDDDEDIYSKDDMSQYDFSELLGNKSEDKNAKVKGMKDKYQSVIEVLEGFTLATKSRTAKNYFPPPELPPNFKPMHKKLPSFEKQSLPNDGVKPKLNPNVRSILLGEKFQKSEEKLKVPVLPRRSRFDVGPTQMSSSQSFSITSSEFKPFDMDDEKQRRYEEYVKMGCNKDHLALLQPPSMTEWERHQEIDEFAKAAVLYQPLSTALKSRFESRSHLGMELTLPLPNAQKKSELDVVTPAKKSNNLEPQREIFEWHPVSLLCKRFNVPNPYPDSQYEGVPQLEKKKKPSLFGNLLCEAETSSEMTPTLPASATSASKSFESLEKTAETEPICVSTSDSVTANIAPQISTIQEIPKGTKPSMDLFKEIFQTSSSEGSSSEEDEKDTKSADPDPSLPPPLSIEDVRTEKDDLNVSKIKNLSVEKDSKVINPAKKGFGVFANLDLDALNKRTPTTHKITPTTPAVMDSNAKNNLADITEKSDNTEIQNDTVERLNDESVPEDLYYGPAPPPPESVPSVASDESISHKHSKHKHKQHKHKVKKKKKKEKKKRSRKGSERSSSESDEDIPSSLILEKLKILKELDKTRKKRK